MSRPTLTHAVDHLWETLQEQGFCNLSAQSATWPWSWAVGEDVQAFLDTKPSRRTVMALDNLVFLLGQIAHAKERGAEWTGPVAPQPKKG